MEINRIEHLNAEVTRGCNLRCDYCFNSSGKKLPDELGLPEWQNVIDLSKTLGARSTLFTGGEVMTRKDSPEIIQHSIARGLETNILSNGYGFEGLTKGFISKLRRVQISLDSASPMTHNTRRGEGSWKIARKAIDFARSYEVPVEISTTISEDRIDELEGLAGIAYATSSKLLVRPMQYIGRAQDKSKQTLNDQLANVQKNLSQVFGDIFVDDFANYVPILGTNHDRIYVPRGYLTVLPDGMIRGTRQNILALSN